MAELEIHHEGAESDPEGKRIGVLTGVMAVLLAIVTILSHRAHTDAVVFKTEANDKWAFYQAKSLKSHALGIGRDLLTAMDVKSAVNLATLKHYEGERNRYEKEAEQIKQEAEISERESKLVEGRALRYDLGEGLLEIGLVLSSLFFIARRKMFPAIGLAAGIAGMVIAASGLLLG